LDFESGARIPQPRIAPNSIDKVVGKPIIIPWPIYAGDIDRDHK